MADISYLKINERSNVERPIVRVTRNIEKTNNSKTRQFFENLRNFANFFIFKFVIEQTSKIWTTSKIIEFS